MAGFIKLTKESKQFADSLPKFDISSINIETLRSKPDNEVPLAISRPDVDLEDMTVISSSGLVKIRVYRPSGSHDKILPAIIYMHGGGWCVDQKASYAYICSKLAGEANCAVIFVHYSLSPEARFPTAVEECYAVLAWATNPANVNFLKIDPTSVSVGGDSSGANLAIAITLLAKQRQLENKIKHQLLFYPVTNTEFNTSSYYEFSNDYALTRDLMKFFWDQYVPEKSDRENIIACPGKATVEDLKDLPPALIIIAEADVVRDEGEDYGRKLLAAGVPATTTRVVGVLHGFVSKPNLFSQETLFALDMAAAALRRAFYNK
ncbi:alpha/beta hydrolase fold-domain-containing protein [Cokeromyces recurvatus]|uniref:alpha/beta hydrolase fold-domain-containing protein n=1 Tax=Cokeromyces recurvatus TaxID=90255 RepID=UPI002220A7A9|nr:alpha/beta hydrolase fold-domain-containing protein [Cokeromyces recurvatus]XP_051380192.1 alpha/beta hydrolase fold-domain-containing protein [Cokeromyces recurvatus]KAI7899077.1 alpha/beta hydrolase fold-domain-containing protein [Cokeromyces recurvatus]KAI7900207.1 alpha/beta hydrolase fold-domain-containing protein [Cokeromyces recurvatus]